MNASMKTPTSPSLRRLWLVALTAVAGLLFVLPAVARAGRPATSDTAKVKSRFDRLSTKGIHGGVLVRGSVLPGSLHARARVTLLLRKGNRGSFKRAASVKLAPDDRNFALLDHVSAGKWGVEVRFQDPGRVVATTSKPKEITVSGLTGRPLIPGSVTVSNGTVTYTASLPHALKSSKVELLGLDVGPVVSGANGASHTAASAFKVVATTHVGTGANTIKFTLRAKLKRGQRWTLLLERSTSNVAVYAGLKTVPVG